MNLTENFRNIHRDKELTLILIVHDFYYERRLFQFHKGLSRSVLKQLTQQRFVDACEELLRQYTIFFYFGAQEFRTDFSCAVRRLRTF